MKISMYQASIPVLKRMLGNLADVLQKGAAHAEAKKIDPVVLIASRLYPDMFALARQVQIASDTAKGCAARLAGAEVPKYEDNEASIEDLKARIAKTIAFAQSLPEAQFAGSDTRSITIPIRGEPVTMVGLKYLNNNVMPNFYFHLVTAYAILRHGGVPLGKGDFIGPAGS